MKPVGTCYAKRASRGDRSAGRQTRRSCRSRPWRQCRVKATGEGLKPEAAKSKLISTTPMSRRRLSEGRRAETSQRYSESGSAATIVPVKEHRPARSV